MIWCCPYHRGELVADDGRLIARCCDSSFPVVCGIPDLRTAQAAWIDPAEDRRCAEDLEKTVDPTDVEGSFRHVFARRGIMSSAMIEQRIARMLDSPARLRAECEGWLNPASSVKTRLLEIGCGGGMLLAAMGKGSARYGLDVSLEWLVVAKRLTAAAGVEVNLAAAHAEALPLPDGCMGGVVALDVMEHVGDQAATLREVDRVLMPGGVFAAATPNRFSVAAEPHVGLWGVGWLPRAWQRRYVGWRGGPPYDYVRLLSYREFQSLMRRNTSLEAVIDPAPIPETEKDRFSLRRRVLARMYNGLLSAPPFHSAARQFGAFFHLVARKR